MTNAQKWVVLILVIFAVLFLISKVTEKEESFENVEFYGGSGETAKVESGKYNALTLMADNRCYMCHTKSLTGSGNGPDLRSVSENWNKEDLIKYLRNPKEFVNNSRLVELRAKYKSPMPGINNLSDKEIEVIAEYLLNIK